MADFKFATLQEGAYGFSKATRIGETAIEFHLFGLRDGELVRVSYTYDVEANTISYTMAREEAEEFTGNFLRLRVTKDFVVVTAADGDEPNISFYNYTLA